MSIFMDLLIRIAFACAMSIPFFFVYNKMVKSKYSNADLNLSKQSFFQKHDMIILNAFSFALSLLVFYLVVIDYFRVSYTYYDDYYGYYDTYYEFDRSSCFFFHFAAGFIQIIMSVLMIIKIKHKHPVKEKGSKAVTVLCVLMCIASAFQIFVSWLYYYPRPLEVLLPLAIKTVVFIFLLSIYTNLVKNNSESEAAQPEQKTVNKVQYSISGDEPVRKNSTKVQYRISDGEDKS